MGDYPPPAQSLAMTTDSNGAAVPMHQQQAFQSPVTTGQEASPGQQQAFKRPRGSSENLTSQEGQLLDPYGAALSGRNKIPKLEDGGVALGGSEGQGQADPTTDSIKLEPTDMSNGPPPSFQLQDQSQGQQGQLSMKSEPGWGQGQPQAVWQQQLSRPSGTEMSPQLAEGGAPSVQSQMSTPGAGGGAINYSGSQDPFQAGSPWPTPSPQQQPAKFPQSPFASQSSMVNCSPAPGAPHANGAYPGPPSAPGSAAGGGALPPPSPNLYGGGSQPGQYSASQSNLQANGPAAAAALSVQGQSLQGHGQSLQGQGQSQPMPGQPQWGGAPQPQQRQPAEAGGYAFQGGAGPVPGQLARTPSVPGGSQAMGGAMVSNSSQLPGGGALPGWSGGAEYGQANGGVGKPQMHYVGGHGPQAPPGGQYPGGPGWAQGRYPGQPGMSAGPVQPGMPGHMASAQGLSAAFSQPGGSWGAPAGYVQGMGGAAQGGVPGMHYHHHHGQQGHPQAGGAGPMGHHHAGMYHSQGGHPYAGAPGGPQGGTWSGHQYPSHMVRGPGGAPMALKQEHMMAGPGAAGMPPGSAPPYMSANQCPPPMQPGAAWSNGPVRGPNGLMMDSGGGAMSRPGGGNPMMPGAGGPGGDNPTAAMSAGSVPGEDMTKMEPSAPDAAGGSAAPAGPRYSSADITEESLLADTAEVAQYLHDLANSAPPSGTADVPSAPSGGEVGAEVLDIELRLCRELARIEFVEPVTHVYNPLTYALDIHVAFLKKYCRSRKTVLFLGMNPGPYGMSQNGIPFGDCEIVRDWLKVEGQVTKPVREHPKRPIKGLACHRKEVSGSRFWSFFRDICGSPESFFENCFIYNCCPFAFMGESGKNLTPTDIKPATRRSIHECSDRALAQVIRVLGCSLVVGVGKYAERRAVEAVRQCTDLAHVRVGWLMHPSPRNPLANRAWTETGTRQLSELGVMDVLGWKGPVPPLPTSTTGASGSSVGTPSAAAEEDSSSTTVGGVSALDAPGSVSNDGALTSMSGAVGGVQEAASSSSGQPASAGASNAAPVFSPPDAVVDSNSSTAMKASSSGDVKPPPMQQQQPVGQEMPEQSAPPMVGSRAAAVGVMADSLGPSPGGLAHQQATKMGRGHVRGGGMMNDFGLHMGGGGHMVNPPGPMSAPVVPSSFDPLQDLVSMESRLAMGGPAVSQRQSGPMRTAARYASTGGGVMGPGMHVGGGQLPAYSAPLRTAPQPVPMGSHQGAPQHHSFMQGVDGAGGPMQSMAIRRCLSLQGGSAQQEQASHDQYGSMAAGDPMAKPPHGNLPPPSFDFGAAAAPDGRGAADPNGTAAAGSLPPDLLSSFGTPDLGNAGGNVSM